MQHNKSAKFNMSRYS